MIAPYIFHDEATAKTLRNNPSFAAEYLNSVLADGNQQELILALRRLAYAFTMKEATDMTLATVTVKTGQRPTKEQLEEVCNAARLAPTADPDCPPSSPAALAEFAEKARSLRKGRNMRSAVTIRMDPACLDALCRAMPRFNGLMRGIRSEPFPAKPRRASPDLRASGISTFPARG